MALKLSHFLVRCYGKRVFFISFSDKHDNDAFLFVKRLYHRPRGFVVVVTGKIIPSYKSSSASREKRLETAETVTCRGFRSWRIYRWPFCCNNPLLILNVSMGHKLIEMYPFNQHIRADRFLCPCNRKCGGIVTQLPFREDLFLILYLVSGWWIHGRTPLT